MTAIDSNAVGVAVAQLVDIQRQFAHAIWHPKAVALDVGANANANIFLEAPGIGVYQNNTRLTLLGAVEATYPVMAQVLGDVFFTSLARSFVITTPSRSGSLQYYALAFSAWLSRWLDALEDRNEAAELGYLPDLARLEALVHHAHSAADAQAFDFAALQLVNPTQQGALCFMLHPSVGLMRSEFPVAQIWRMHQVAQRLAAAEGVESIAVDWDCAPEQNLLWRQSLSQFEIAVNIRQCTAGEFQFLTDLAAGATFMQAASNVLSVDADADLQALLLGLVHDGVIVGFTEAAPTSI